MQVEIASTGVLGVCVLRDSLCNRACCKDQIYTDTESLRIEIKKKTDTAGYSIWIPVAHCYDGLELLE